MSGELLLLAPLARAAQTLICTDTDFSVLPEKRENEARASLLRQKGKWCSHVRGSFQTERSSLITPPSSHHHHMHVHNLQPPLPSPYSSSKLASTSPLRERQRAHVTAAAAAAATVAAAAPDRSCQRLQIQMQKLWQLLLAAINSRKSSLCLPPNTSASA